MNVRDQAVKWIEAQLAGAGAHGLVFGLSGGIDSAVCGALCREAAGEKALGVIMPCHSIPGDMEDALLVAGAFGIEVITVDLTGVFNEFVTVLPEAGMDAKANLKPRLRMSTLYYLARDLGYLVAGTGNKSELNAGYFTKHGDGAADILPLGGLYKTEVIAMAQELGVPQAVIEKPPSAGLREGQTDESDLGVTYRELDYVLKSRELGLKPEASDEVIKRVEDLRRSSEHKRTPVPVFNPKQ
ncbi:MAG: NAD(+) synthase [Actinobacteria bacterium]|nr:NAD(+) synthase [Actinomycetota bacterium]